MHDDLLLLAPKKEQADPSEIPNLSSSNKDPDVLWNSTKNKFSRMPKDQMNILSTSADSRVVFRQRNAVIRKDQVDNRLPDHAKLH